VVLTVESEDPGREWLYEAGSAVGALGGRAVVVQLAPGSPPPELSALERIGSGEDLGSGLAAALRAFVN
jgi:hypothetical protein